MVNCHRNHPSVIIWSIGNENEFGGNFKKSYDWVKTTDPSRPVIFSYPGKVPDSMRSYDIISMHYPGTDGNMNQYGITTSAFGHGTVPVLFDEWAHVACYNSGTVKEDPNIRDFWGISLDSMWQKVFASDGGVGGAIWCMVDETFMLPEDLPGYNEWWGKLDKNVIPGEFTGHTIGYGEWGIIDIWRRKKPEFWNVKKAYSPVRILKTENYEFTPGKPVEIPVLNRFDFTNLNELILKMTINGRTLTVIPPDIAPHTEGIIAVEVDEWPAGEKLLLDFTDKSGNLTDSYSLSCKQESFATDSSPANGLTDLEEKGNEYKIICGNGISFTIDKSTGLFSGFENISGKKQFSGPYASLRVLGKEIIYSSYIVDNLCTDWKLSSLSAGKSGNVVSVEINGSYSGNIIARYLVQISPSGEIETEYKISGIPDGKLREAGIQFVFNNDFDSLAWERKTYWSKYPSGHLSEKDGIVPLYTSDNKMYRKAPGKEWSYDKKSFFYNGTENETDDQLINAARATKENIFKYTVKLKGDGMFTVTGNGNKSCRIEKTGNNIRLNICDFIDYPDISWGNYSRNIKLNGILTGKTGLILESD
jgi:beta-galactosidase